MAETSTPQTYSEPRWFDRNDRLLRRLFSLTGIVPIGVFLVVHLLTSSSIAWGASGPSGVERFGKGVSWPHQQARHLGLIEVVLWASIAFHSILGVVYAVKGKTSVARHGYQESWWYALQRISGYVGILFIFYHVATLRWGWTRLVPGGARWDAMYAASTLAAALQGSTEGLTTWGVLVSAFYFLGVSLLIFHFANGLWTAGITWGLTITRRAQQRWGCVCAAVGVGLMAVGWASLFRFVTLPYETARAMEMAVGVQPLMGGMPRR